MYFPFLAFSRPVRRLDTIIEEYTHIKMLLSINPGVIENIEQNNERFKWNERRVDINEEPQSHKNLEKEKNQETNKKTEK